MRERVSPDAEPKSLLLIGIASRSGPAGCTTAVESAPTSRSVPPPRAGDVAPGVKTISTYGGYSGRAPAPKILVKAATTKRQTSPIARRYPNQLPRSSRMPSTFVADVRDRADAYRDRRFSASRAANWSRRR